MSADLLQYNQLKFALVQRNWCRYHWWKLLLVIALTWTLTARWYSLESVEVRTFEQIINENVYDELSFLGARQPRIYVYNTSETARMSQINCFWPHAGIDSAFVNQLHGSLLRAQSLEEADLAYLPIPFAFWYYTNQPHVELISTKSYVQRNEDFREYWASQSHTLANESVRKRVPHFIVFSYACYRCSFKHIPDDIIILTYERYSVTGEPDDEMADAGCGMRCIVIPYFTTHSNESIIQKSSDLDSYLQQRRLLSFIGSLNRTKSLIRFRKEIVNTLKKSYAPNETFMLAKSLNSSEIRKVYGESRFCIQLPGDTPTRMGFYDSLLEECTPVILESSLFVYEFLFGGLLPIRDAVITIPDWLTTNSNEHSQELLQTLTAANTPQETAKRLRAIRFINQYIRWNAPIKNSNFSGPVFASLIAISNFEKLKPIRAAYYVYDLPQEANVGMLLGQGIQISKGENLKINRSTEDSLKTAAFGDVFKPDLPIYGDLLANRHQTSQYSMEMIFHVRMLQHPQRTPDIKQATAAFIPAYLFLSHWHEVPLVWNANSVKKLCDKLLFNLTKWSSSKIPHIIPYSDVAWNKPGYPFYTLDLPKNTYIFTLEEAVETYLTETGSQILTVPYPTSVHAYSSRKASTGILPNFCERRRYILSYAGRTRWPVNLLPQNRSDVKIVRIDLPGWRSFNNENVMREILNMYRQSTFTLQPHGDMGTRRAFYDSLTVGAIPVVFENNKQSYLSLFRGASDIENGMIVIPTDVKRNTSNTGEYILTYLHRVGLKELERRRRFIWNNLRRFQYSVVHDEEDALAWSLRTVESLQEK